MTFNPSAASLFYLEQEVSGRSRVKGYRAGWSCVSCSQSLWLWHIKRWRVEKVNSLLFSQIFPSCASSLTLALKSE